VAACASLVLAGCGGGDGATRPAADSATSAQYIAAVEDVLSPAAALAGLASDRLSGQSTSARGASGLVEAAGEELADLRRLELADPGLFAQRARLVRALGPLLARMRSVARDLVANDMPGLRRSGQRLFEVIKELPSATSA
jgi:hypothetical protein